VELHVTPTSEVRVSTLLLIIAENSKPERLVRSSSA